MTTNNDLVKKLDDLIGEPESFGQLVWAFRQCENLSQEALAKRIGVSKQYISAIENGHKLVSIEQAKKLAEIFEMPPKMFIESLMQQQLNNCHVNYKVELHGAA